MKFTTKRDQLLKGLQFVTGVVERRQSLPILSHVLIRAQNNRLSLVGSDLEIELTGHAELIENEHTFETTVSGRKLMDICRTLPENADICFQLDGAKAAVIAGKSRFSLVTLPSSDFPLAAFESSGKSVKCLQSDFAALLESTSFAMAQQDVRFYLNGLFFEANAGNMCSVATDGHRLAVRKMDFPGLTEPTQFILPRKGVFELLRLLSKDEGKMLSMLIGPNAIRLESDTFTFVSRLIEGKFPDYRRVIPQGGDKKALVDRDTLKHALARAAILTNEKYHAVRLHFSSGVLLITATNTEQEEAKEEISMNYEGESLEMGFNVNYLLDVLSAVPSGDVTFTLSSADNSVLIYSDALEKAQFVIMPMSL
jgi:DNA polymerase-3 subunit beta